MSSCRRYGRTTCTEKAMSNGVRTAVVVVCGLFIGGLGAIGMPRASSRARMGGGCSGFQGTLGLRVRGANLGASASRGPAGLRRARMRYPGNSAGSLPRLCGEPRGRILVPCRPRSHAERGSLHGRARMRAGSAGSNVPSREGDLRVTDRDIGPGSAPAPHIATYRHLRPNLAAATPQPGACPARPFEILTCPGATAATSGR